MITPNALKNAIERQALQLARDGYDIGGVAAFLPDTLNPRERLQIARQAVETAKRERA